MLYFRRRLPHWIPDHAIVFVTWRLAGSMPPASPDVLTVENTGRASFRVRDERLDRSTCGPFWLRETRIASIIEDALLYGEATRPPCMAGLSCPTTFTQFSSLTVRCQRLCAG